MLVSRLLPPHPLGCSDLLLDLWLLPSEGSCSGPGPPCTCHAVLQPPRGLLPLLDYPTLSLLDRQFGEWLLPPCSSAGSTGGAPRMVRFGAWIFCTTLRNRHRTLMFKHPREAPHHPLGVHPSSHSLQTPGASMSCALYQH